MSFSSSIVFGEYKHSHHPAHLLHLKVFAFNNIPRYVPFLYFLRIKKLIDLEAMSLSRLQVVVLDMQRDAKSFSLFTLPQVRLRSTNHPNLNSFMFSTSSLLFLIFIFLFELLFVLPSTEFWDLYRIHLEPKVLCGDTRICFYGAVRNKDVNKALASAE